MGSDMMRIALAAETAAVRCRNDRREKRGIGASGGRECIRRRF
jgi:hypothetical protein